MKKGNKIIQCGGCGKRVVVVMNGRKGYVACKCGTEYRVDVDAHYGVRQVLARVSA